jgi:hypothetical protein
MDIDDAVDWRLIASRWEERCQRAEAALKDIAERAPLIGGDAWLMRDVARRAIATNSADEIERLREAAGRSVYLREVDAGSANACWIPCAKGDPGAVMFIARD